MRWMPNVADFTPSKTPDPETSTSAEPWPAVQPEKLTSAPGPQPAAEPAISSPAGSCADGVICGEVPLLVTRCKAMDFSHLGFSVAAECVGESFDSETARSTGAFALVSAV